MKALKALLSGIPYHEGRAPEDEQEWRNIIYAVFAILGQYVRAEIHSANGRSDCIVENRDYIYIFELKEDKTADEALQQIDDNNYAGPYMMSGKKIIKIGASFSGKERTLSSWKIA
ncbi:MAG: PD-(D/E)XK nuclease domain-containing protein [Lachnospiraceae bacterium]|nr:PD-(D/E)XK nuclease domain-containing protein [Lachnospiraceae bacterium]